MLTSTDLNKAFEAIQEESSHFYRISCRMPVSRDLNRYRRFTVKVRREGASVTGRKGRYSDITPMDRVVSSSQPSVDSVDRYRQLAMRGVATPLAAANAKTTPVDVVMEVLGPIEIATDASGAGSIDLDIRLVARVADEVVTRYERSLTAKVKPEGVGPVKQAFRVEGRLDLLPGIYDLQGTVRLASPPQMATWSGQVLVPPHSPNPPPSIRGPYLIDAESPTPLLHHPAVDEASDPFTVGSGHRVLPMVSTSVDAGRNVLTMFWLDGFPAEAGKPPDATLSVRVRDAAGHEVEAPAQLVLFTADPAGGYRAMSRVETSKLPAGAYVLTVGAASADKIAPRRSVPFSIAVTSSSSSGSP